MSMKPRLDDGPVNYEGLATQAKRVPENAPLSNSNLASCSHDEKPAHLVGIQKPEPHVGGPKE